MAPSVSDLLPAQHAALSAVAAERLRRRGLLAIAAEVLREPMFLLLVAAGVVYVVLGDPTEALMLLGSVVLITGMTLYQENKTERALDRLRIWRARGPRRPAAAHPRA